MYDHISIIQINCKEEGIESTDEPLATENKVKPSSSPGYVVTLTQFFM